MALLDFLKNKKEVKSVEKPVKKSAKISNIKKEENKTEKTIPVAKISKNKDSNKIHNDKNFSYEAIKQPHISEKSSYLAEKDQYIFEVLPNYNKKEIKKSLEGIYGVDVLSVNIIKIPSKKRRLGRIEGFKKSYKKAIVKIRNGQKIEIL